MIDSQTIEVHPFYRDNALRVHEIPAGRKGPIATGWPDAQRYADDIEPLLDGSTFNKYGWLLDDCHIVIDIDVHDPEANGYDSLAKLETEIGFKLGTSDPH